MRVAGRDQELAGDLDGDAEEIGELGCRLFDQNLDLAAECLHLFVQGLPASGQVPEASLHRRQEQPVGISDQLDEVLGLRPQTQTSVHQCSLAELQEFVPKRRGSTDHDAVKAEKGLRAGLHGARTSHPKNPDDLNRARLRLGHAGGRLGQHGSSHLLGIQAVGLAISSPGPSGWGG